MIRFVRSMLEGLVVMGALVLPVRVLAGPAPSPNAPMRIVYPSAEAVNDDRGNYYVNLLKLVMSKADGNFVVEPSKSPSVAVRALMTIAAGGGIDVVWSPSSFALERDFLPIRIPLDKGILGWRLFLIRSQDLDRFAAIRTFDQLKRETAGQVTEWVDTDIMRANGLHVVDTTLYESLFKMLAAKRFSYLPRGVAEIGDEARKYAGLGLVIEPHLALHYPACTYFFVAKRNTALARQIEQGLRRAQKDGSFEQLFQQFNGKAIEAAALNKRRVFDLSNPAAPAEHQAECSAAMMHALK